MLTNFYACAVKCKGVSLSFTCMISFFFSRVHLIDLRTILKLDHGEPARFKGRVCGQESIESKREIMRR